MTPSVNKTILLLFLIAGLTFCQPKSRGEKYNLIYISLDTTRFDFVNTGNGSRAYTPALKEFSKDALVFTRAFAAVPETLPSHLSVFTSYSPHQLGVLHNHSRYRNTYPLLQEVLKANHYTTYGVISLISLVEPGFWKGFDEFNRELCSREVEHQFVTADKISQAAMRKLDVLAKKKFFMFVHYSDPHYPYGPPTVKATLNIYLDDKKIARLNPYRGGILPRRTLTPGTHRFRFEMESGFPDFKGLGIIELTKGLPVKSKSQNIAFREDIFSGCHFMSGERGWINLTCAQSEDIHLQILPRLKKGGAIRMYQKEVEFMDRHLGRFIRHIKKRGLMKKTIVVVFSDHGEGLGERDNYFGHVDYLNQQFIRVPLVIHIPGKKGQIIDTPVSLSGLSSTILELLNLSAPSFKNSFLDSLEKGDTHEKTIASFTYGTPDTPNKISLIQWPHQGICNWTATQQSNELYDLGPNNCFSQENQIDQSVLPSRARRFFSLFLKRSQKIKREIQRAAPAGKNIDRRKLKKLKALGYIN